MNLASYLEFVVGQLLRLEFRQPILPTLYESSWMVRLTDSRGETLYPGILEELAASQHPDGSWGSKTPYYHDRVLTTLEEQVKQSTELVKNKRLLGVQDLAWALINNPSFLFNR